MSRNNPPNPMPSRRTALKAMVGVGTGAVVWTEPTIRGLARRPAFAAAGTDDPFTVSFSGMQTFLEPPLVTTTIDTFTTAEGVTIDLQLTAGFDGATMTVVTSDPECVCTITGGTATITLVDLFGSFDVPGTIGGGVVTFSYPPPFQPPAYDPVVWDLTISCE